MTALTSRRKAEYFIEVDTFLWNSRSYFIGPFDSREQAGLWLYRVELDRVYVDGDQRAAVKNDWRIYPWIGTRTSMRQYKDSMRQIKPEYILDQLVDRIALTPEILRNAVEQNESFYSYC